MQGNSSVNQLLLYDIITLSLNSKRIRSFYHDQQNQSLVPALQSIVQQKHVWGHFKHVNLTIPNPRFKKDYITSHE